jgi:conjugal transfer pilus assembly protein TraD
LRNRMELNEQDSLLDRFARWYFYRNREIRMQDMVPEKHSFSSLARLNEENKKAGMLKERTTHMGIGIKKESYKKVSEKKLANFVPKEIYIPDEWRLRHFLCFGSTGSGKTKLMTYMIYQDILKGNNVAVFNPKSDPMGKDNDTAGNELLSYIVQACVQAGRLDDLLVVTPLFPDCSIEVNPLKHFMIEDELIQHVISSVKSKEQYFENVAYEVSTAIIMSLVVQERIKGNNPNINFMDVKEKIDYAALQALGNSIEYYKNFPDPDIREKIEMGLLTIRQIGRSPQDFFSKVSSSLRTVMTTLTTSVAGKIIGCARDNEFIERLQSNKRVVFVCNTDNSLMPRASHIINRAIISMIIAAAGRAGAHGMMLNNPLSVYVDEGHNVLFSGIEEFFGKGRSAQIYLHLFTQSVSEILKVVGEDVAKSILNNINTWCVMKTNDPDTAEYLASASPETTEWTPVVTMGGGKDPNINLRAISAQLITKDAIMGLEQTFYYLRNGYNYMNGKVPHIPPPSLRVIMPEASETELKKYDKMIMKAEEGEDV